MQELKNKHLKKYAPIVLKLGLSMFLAICILVLYFLLAGSEIKLPLSNDEDYSTNYKLTNLQESQQVHGVDIGPHDLVLNQYDYRARIFDLFFRANNSPLEGHGQDFADACDKYHTPEDCTLLPAIAKVETDLCKTDISSSQYNCWGYGGSGENRIIYKSFEESIDQITGRLMNGYGAGFFKDPEAGELFYCGSHCNLWGDNVKSVQKDLKQFAILNGYTL